MRDNIDPYSPCFCGSGKKYRFCCQRRYNNQLALPASQQPVLVTGDLEEGERLHFKGLKCMKLGKYEQAIPWFIKANEANKAFFNPANNLALCLFITGKHDEAIRVQRQSLDNSPLPNPFGVANLSMFLLFLGDEKGADETASFAAELKAPNPDATVKVCETLARFRRHRDILATADASDFASDPNVCFYSGVAAANLGDRKRAKQDLSCIPSSHPKAKMTQQYLQHLKNKTQPNTVRKDWPYLLPEEFYISNLISKDEGSKALMSRRYMVDLAEAMLNANPEAPDTAMQVLECSKHPEASALLWLILKGKTYGSDQLRLKAASILTRKGEIQPGEDIKFLTNGKSTKQKLFSICLNSDFAFCELPPDLEQPYKKLILAGHKLFANWTKIALGYEKLMQEAPQYYPFRYNYAVGLVHCKRRIEAEKILRSLMAEYPEYLFARASLLSILVNDNRLAEAKKLVKATDFPKETHPDAYVAWLVSMAVYSEALGENAEVFTTIQVAHKIAPDNPNVKKLWGDWKDYDEENDTSAYLRIKRIIKK